MPAAGIFAIQEFSYVASGGYYPRNAGGNDFWMCYALPLPMSIGSLDLHIMGCKISIIDADANDNMTKYHVVGLKADQTYTIVYQEDTAGATSPGMYEDGSGSMVAWGAATDMSPYIQVIVALWMSVAAFADLDWTTPILQCYYA